MKKVAAIALAAVMSSSIINVSAAGRMENIMNSISDTQINILYNDSVIQYQDVKPVNTDGRVMIPFRVVLESMGATVEYDDSQRLVTAKKDDIEIKFTLMDDTIYVNKNGEESTVKMDTPMIIVEDRTLVPIRFMSEALGMQVGWDGDTETVLVMDYDDYFEEFENVIPNLIKTAQLGQNTKYNSENMTFNVDFDTIDVSQPISLDFGGELNGVYDDSVKSIDSSYDITYNGETVSFNMDLILDGTDAYIKTDLIEKIAEKTTDASVKAAALLFEGDTWYKIDIKKVMDSLPIGESNKKIIEAAMLSGNSDDIIELLKNSISTEGDADFDEVMMLAMQLDAYEEIDKYIEVTEKENGEYSVLIDISEQEFSDILKAITGVSDDSIKISLKANSDYDGSKFTSGCDISMDIAVRETEKAKCTITLKDSCEQNDNIKVPSVPEGAEDRTQILIDAIN